MSTPSASEMLLAGAYQQPEKRGPIVRVSGVNFWYERGTAKERQVLFATEKPLEIFPGEVVIMSGPSGSGKSTLLSLLGGLRSLQEGQIEIWDGYRKTYHQLHKLSEAGLTKVRRLIGFIFQRHNLFSSLTAVQNVRMAQRLKQRDPTGTRQIEDLLRYLGLEQVIQGLVTKISVGQSQRVAVARALINQPRLVLADEPTAPLDPHSGLAVMTLLRHLSRKQSREALLPLRDQPEAKGNLTLRQIDWLLDLEPPGTTSLVVTHDSRIMNTADRIIHMEAGRIEKNIVVAERRFLLEMMRHCPAFTVLLPEQQEDLADKLSIGVAPDSELSPEDLQKHKDKVRFYPSGATIIKAGTIPGQGEGNLAEAYFLRSGTVAIKAGDRTIEVKPGPFGYFGERSLILDTKRNASIVAAEDAIVYTVGAQTIEDYKKTASDFITRFLKAYADHT